MPARWQGRWVKPPGFQYKSRRQKSQTAANEITAIPELLKILAIAVCIVTIDAIGTQTKNAKTIIDGGTDYLLSVKENQAHLHEDIEKLFDYNASLGFKDTPYDYDKTVNKGHGRIEIRECWSTSDAEYLQYLRGYERWESFRVSSKWLAHVLWMDSKPAKLVITSLS